MNNNFQLIKSINVSAKTMMYMYCKAVHGKLVSEDAEGFVWQYESFCFDDDKVPLVMSVVHAQVSETTQVFFS